MTDYNRYILSTGTHWISNSGSDENKAYHGGKAGDQTGHEWELKAWYSRPWSCILRYPNQAVASKIAQLSIDAALNDNIGYDQYQRETYWQQLKAVGYDPSKIAVKCEEDCTAGVSANVKAVGHLMGIEALQDVSICTSRNMRSVFTGAGFTAITDDRTLRGFEDLMPGDILLYEGHHAATNVTVGARARAQWLPAGERPSTVRATCSAFIRACPSKAAQPLGVVAPGTRLDYFGYTHEDYWHLVKYGDLTGWISHRCGEVE